MKTGTSFAATKSKGSRAILDSPLFISGLIFAFILILTWNYLYTHHVDSNFYIKMAKGIPVKKPFSGRIFYPMIASLIHTYGGLSLNHAFLLANSLGLLLLILSVTLFIQSITSYAIIAVPILLTPLLIRSYSLPFLPDLFTAGLTGIFFYLLYRSYFWPSLLVLLMAYLTRENTLFLCLSLVVVGLYKSRLRWAVGGALVLLLSIVITSWAGRSGLPQEYHMNFLLYLALKIPKNFLYNVFGLLIWTNVYPDVGHPFLFIHLPAWLPLGRLHTIGITPLQPLVSLNTIMLLLTTFGVAPSMLIVTLIKNWKQILSEEQFWLQVALLYGVSSFLIGVAVSYDVIRLIGYAWPVFWLAVPYLLLKYFQLNTSSIAQLLCYQVVACWLPWMMRIPWFTDKVTMDSPIPFLVVIFSSIVLQFLALRTVSRRQESLNFA